jgi:diguanylate cyclase (GGDEF)-like protein
MESAMMMAERAAADAKPAGTSAVKLCHEDMERAVAAAGDAAYHWNIMTDELTWSSNCEAVLGCTPTDLATGKRFSALLDPDNLTSRYDTVLQSKVQESTASATYQIEYRFCPTGKSSSIWVEDTGRWVRGRDGRPVEAFGVVRRIDERQKREQELNASSGRDPLTGMMNRARLSDTIGEAIATAQQEGNHCGFALAVVNNLPLVNEAYGFEVADEVIAAIAKRLQQVLRGGDAIGRYSGSKFGVILNSCSPKDLPTALERFLAVVRDSVIETSYGPVWAMLSVGGISIPEHARSAANAMAHAEDALNEARQLATDGAVIYQPSEKRKNEQHLNARCAAEIVQSLKDDDFKLAYQPIKDAKTGKIVMHEALLRMIDDGGEIITAGHLIPVAERLGLVRLIDRAVTQMTIAALHSHPEARITMNVSATTATDRRWYSQLLEIIEANKDVADRLIIEITETVALNNLAETRDFVERLRVLGCGIAIDDFGAGYTSFRNVRDLPVTAIKLDGSFCRNLTSNKDNVFFVKSLVELAHTFNLKVVAEWVESEEDEKLLIAWGVDFLQGNFIGPADVKPAWLSETGAEFDLTPKPSMPAVAPKLETSALLHAVIDLAADTESPAVGVEEPVPVATGNPSDATLSDDQEFEADIIKLRGTLDLLNQFFPPTRQAEAQDATAA